MFSVSVLPDSFGNEESRVASSFEMTLEQVQVSLFSSDADIEVVTRDMQKVKIEGDLKDYLNRKIGFNKDGLNAWIRQPHLIKKLHKLFEEEIVDKHNCGTPGMPGFTVIRGEEFNKVTKEVLEIRSWRITRGYRGKNKVAK